MTSTVFQFRNSVWFAFFDRFTYFFPINGGWMMPTFGGLLPDRLCTLRFAYYSFLLIQWKMVSPERTVLSELNRISIVKADFLS